MLSSKGFIWQFTHLFKTEICYSLSDFTLQLPRVQRCEGRYCVNSLKLSFFSFELLLLSISTPQIHSRRDKNMHHNNLFYNISHYSSLWQKALHPMFNSGLWKTTTNTSAFRWSDNKLYNQVSLKHTETFKSTVSLCYCWVLLWCPVDDEPSHVRVQ